MLSDTTVIGLTPDCILKSGVSPYTDKGLSILLKGARLRFLTSDTILIYFQNLYKLHSEFGLFYC